MGPGLKVQVLPGIGPCLFAVVCLYCVCVCIVLLVFPFVCLVDYCCCYYFYYVFTLFNFFSFGTSFFLYVFPNPLEVFEITEVVH